MSCCNRHSPESTARKVEDDYTAISPIGVLSPLKFSRAESGRKPLRPNVFGRISHKPKMAVGPEGRTKTDM